MKILQITSHLNTGGITHYVLTLSRQLVQNGHQVIIASGRGEKLAELERIGIKHWESPFHASVEFSPRVFQGICQLAKLLRQEPVDVIHAHTRVGQVAAAVVSRRLKIPYVTTWHGVYKTRLGRLLWPCTGVRTIAISELVREHLQNDFHVPLERVCRIYNGVDVNYYASIPSAEVVGEFRQRWGISTGEPVIGGIGRLASGGVKGFDIFLAATQLLKRTIPNLKTLIVGEGPRRSFLENAARRLRIQENVCFVGTSNNIRIPLALMDVFVFTSRWPEAFGLTVVEAMAAGKPVVATRVGAVPEIIRHGVDGWIVSPNDPAAIADGVASLLSDKKLAEKLGRQGQEKVNQMFSLERMVGQIEEVYREAAQS